MRPDLKIGRAEAAREPSQTLLAPGHPAAGSHAEEPMSDWRTEAIASIKAQIRETWGHIDAAAEEVNLCRMRHAEARLESLRARLWALGGQES